ncbi:MAG: flavin-dependent dehydrogenase, partial [Hydrococcus sp. CRU_1_1]|nr:flavin-dependent dehydrogenase [Hydrococcus sp. CRU_1_1]
MREILYREVTAQDTASVLAWLHLEWQPTIGKKVITPDGIRLQFSQDTSKRSQTIPESELSIFVWSVQRTTYLKVFRWGEQDIREQNRIVQQLIADLSDRFPQRYPKPPEINLKKQSIFEALDPYYPKTVHFFQKMPKGEYDLQRAYWWEQRWRESVNNPQQPKQVVFKKSEVGANGRSPSPEYDLIYIGGALGAIHAAVMAKLGYKVLIIERLPFGRMNREWNISRSEFQNLIDLGLFTAQEFESLIAREYVDGFNKFFDGNLPPHLKAAVLHTPTVLNIAIASDKLLDLCGEKLRQAGGEIWDETEFIRADIDSKQVEIQLGHLPTGELKQVSGRLLIDAMGTASPIAWQLNGKRTFDSVCPTVGAVVEGFEPEVWDANYGDVLNSHGDISRGRQLIWELFPAAGEELTIYLFHYHQVHPENPGSLLEMYEDFFTILPEYRRCDMEKLVWKKPTFGYIPGHFSVGSRDRTVAFDRLLGRIGRCV